MHTSDPNKRKAAVAGPRIVSRENNTINKNSQSQQAGPPKQAPSAASPVASDSTQCSGKEVHHADEASKKTR